MYRNEALDSSQLRIIFGAFLKDKARNKVNLGGLEILEANSNDECLSCRGCGRRGRLDMADFPCAFKGLIFQLKGNFLEN